MAGPRIIASPTRCLMDEVISINVAELQPNIGITVAAFLEESRMRFVSYGHYRTNHLGRVDLTRDASTGGTYIGVEPMGLFWSMVQAPGQRPGLRVLKKDVENPMAFHVAVYPSHVIPSDGNLKEVCSTTIYRSYKADNVRQIDIREGNIRARMFLPPGNGPFPGVIDVYGSAGGIIAHRAALLASRGFVTLALAYFNYDDLKESLGVDMKYFEEAAEWFLQQSCVNGRIGFIGTSYGAELSLFFSSHYHKISAVVCISGCIYATYEHSYAGTKHPMIPLDSSLARTDEEGNFILCDILGQKSEPARILIENIQAPVLFVYGMDDQNLPPRVEEDVAEVEKEHGKLNITIRKYEGAGHLIEPPYAPLCKASYNTIVSGLAAWGGKTVAHARCQEQAWPEIINFLRKHLNPTEQASWNNSAKL